VLESNLIKKHKPRFNVFLKDDKSYPHLKLTNEPFPKVVITRKIVRDGSSYYGPFLPASLARNTLNLVNRAFPLRTCDIDIDGKLPRPCLEYHLKRCLGPCVKGLCTQDEYQEAARDVKVLLEGKNKELARDLEQRMWKFSDEGKFEIAARYRDLHRTVIALGEQQKMATTADRDVYKRARAFWGATFDPQCEAAAVEPSTCFMAPHWYQHVSQRLPVLIQQSVIDEAFTRSHGITAPSPVALKWRTQTNASLAGVSWLFSGKTAYHTLALSDEGLQTGPSGSTLAQVLGRFWKGQAAERIVF
jgi:hypothetical protein